jgi:hypothetical protein
MSLRGELRTVISRRRLIASGFLVLAGTYLLAGGLIPTQGVTEGTEVNSSQLVQPAENGSYLWPYTSRQRSPQGRSLAVNLVVYGDDERVRRVLTERSSLNWELTGPEDNETLVADERAGRETGEEARTQPVEFEESAVDWNDAHGSTRYSYIDARPRGGDATWTVESFQVHAGNYFGSRHHIRAYTLPETEWTALQVHQEYWDWFRLRHTVTDIRDARTELENDFIDRPYVDRVGRNYYGVTEGRNDGWLTEIELVPGIGFALLLVGGLLTRETRQSVVREGRRLLDWSSRNVRGFVLAAALASVYVGVRSVAVVFELTVPAVDPRVFLAVLYPAIALGLPALSFSLAQPFGATSRFERVQHVSRWLGPKLEPLAAFGFVVAGLGSAFVLDFGGMGIRTIPVQVALHRVGLTVALGLVAAGATDIDERGVGLLVIGSAGWVLGLLMPLFGYI